MSCRDVSICRVVSCPARPRSLPQRLAQLAFVHDHERGLVLLTSPALQQRVSLAQKEPGTRKERGPFAVCTVTSRLPPSRTALLALLKPTKSGRAAAMGRGARDRAFEKSRFASRASRTM